MVRRVTRQLRWTGDRADTVDYGTVGADTNADVEMTQVAGRIGSKNFALDRLWYGGGFCQSGRDAMKMGHASPCMMPIPLFIAR